MDSLFENLPDINPELIDFPTTESVSGSSFNRKNYLDTKLGENEDSKELVIRLLPMDIEKGSAFAFVKTHSVKVPTKLAPSGWKSFICLRTRDIDHSKYGHKCPFCEMNHNAYETSLSQTDPVKKKAWQDISLENKQIDTVIVRCIERGKENEGVKFWKFNLRSDKTDPYNQIISLYNKRKEMAEKKQKTENILSCKDGRDLIIQITKGNSAPIVIDDSEKTPLSKDIELAKSWIYDTKKWQDVFPAKPYDYLSVVASKEIPWFDKETGKWIPKPKNTPSEENNHTEVKIDTDSDYITSLSLNDEGSLPGNDYSGMDNDDDLPF